MELKGRYQPFRFSIKIPLITFVLVFACCQDGVWEEVHPLTFGVKDN